MPLSALRCCRLFGLPVEFVDSQHLGSCMRKRGYIHNLPISGRFLPPDLQLPKKILEAVPELRGSAREPFWPSWDTREKFNCVNTMKENGRKLLEGNRIAREIAGIENELESAWRREFGGGGKSAWGSLRGRVRRGQ